MPFKILDVGDEYADFLHDESRMEGCAERIAFPESTEDVCEALALAAGAGWPVTVQGGRTGITGGCVPNGGLILNLSRMNRIGPVENMHLTVQPGSVLSDIRRVLEDTGCFFPSDLTETSATIGGMIANNASGARSYRYGSVRPWIHALAVVLPGGEKVVLERGVHRADGLDFAVGSLAGRLPEIALPSGVKSAAGYFVQPDMDLVDLFIGAEGTLGIVTEAVLKLQPERGPICGLAAFFADEPKALDFTRFLQGSACPLAIEFFDERALDLLRRMKSDNEAFAALPELRPEFRTALYFEFDDDVPPAVADAVEARAVDCWMADAAPEIGILKQFRHAVPESVNLLIAERRRAIPELTKLGTDMSAPIGRMDEVMSMYHAGLAEAGLEYVVFGHLGNNHVHVNILPRSLDEYERGRALYLEWAERIVSMGGSVSAEHGIGKLKTAFLALMFGEEGVAELHALKLRFDPSGRLNPGNLFGDV